MLRLEFYGLGYMNFKIEINIFISSKLEIIFFFFKGF